MLQSSFLLLPGKMVSALNLDQGTHLQCAISMQFGVMDLTSSQPALQEPCHVAQPRVLHAAAPGQLNQDGPAVGPASLAFAGVAHQGQDAPPVAANAVPHGHLPMPAQAPLLHELAAPQLAQLMGDGQPLPVPRRRYQVNMAQALPSLTCKVLVNLLANRCICL